MQTGLLYIHSERIRVEHESPVTERLMDHRRGFGGGPWLTLVPDA